MSVDTLREDFWHSTLRSTIRERCLTIFNQELLSDIKFVVRDSGGGSESKTIPAHKFVLAISSPVFFAMFYGELAETKDYVEISDCDYESLLELFRFIYSDEANLNPDNVMQLMYLAKKYMVPSLADRCSAYFQENLDASNVFHVLPGAQKYEEKDLLDHCWKVIETETGKAVKSDGFMTIERSALEELVEKDTLNIKEVELFKAVDCWAVNECRKQRLEAEGSMKRRILGERIVKGIRFPLMEQTEFADVVLDSDILTKKESYDLVKHFNSVLKSVTGFSSAKRTGTSLNVLSRFRSVSTGCGWHYSTGVSNCIGLKANKDVKVHAVRLFGSANNEYSVTLTVRDGNGFVLATEGGNFLSKPVQSEIGDYQGFDVAFGRPIALKANSAFVRFEAKINGSSSYYGQGGQFQIKHSGVVFSFDNYISFCVSTNVQTRQFPEFLFSLV